MTEVLSTSLRRRDAGDRLPHDLLNAVVERSCAPVVVYRDTDSPVYLNGSARLIWPAEQSQSGRMCVLVDGKPTPLSTFRTLTNGSAKPATIHLARLPDGREYGVDAYTWCDAAGDDCWQVVALRPVRRTLTEVESFQDKIDRLKSIAHELRNTLASAREALAFVDDGAFGELNAEQRRYIQLARDDLQLMTRMLADLVVLWTTQASVFRISMAPIEIRSIVEQASLYVSLVAERANISLCIGTGDPLPPLVGDHDLLVQAVRNVLNNALQFTPSGGEVHVRTFLSQTKSPETPAQCCEATLSQDADGNSDKSVVIEIRDSGVGVPQHDQERVFRPYERGRAGTNEVRLGAGAGMGLGLSIAREIAWTHGGTLCVEADPKRGSCFTFTFPLSQVNARRGSERVIQRAIDEANAFNGPLAAVLLCLECDDGGANDLLFSSVQQTAIENLRPTDTVLAIDHRLLILMRGETRGVATAVVDRILGALTEISGRHAAAFSGNRLRFGVAAYPEDGDSAGGLLQCAEAELQEAVFGLGAPESTS